MSKYDHQKGVEMFNTVYCGDLPQQPEPGINKFSDFMLETLFGTLWADETLSIRDRRLMLLGAIAAQGEENTFGIQARSALKRGEITKEQLEAAVMFLTQYIGYPRGSKMYMMMNKVFAELN